MNLQDYEVIGTCPLGSECEKIDPENKKIYRCNWYKRLYGKDPQSEDMIDRWDCSIGWQPTLQTEMAQTNRGQTEALESFRNEVVSQNDKLIQGLTHAASKRLTKEAT